MCNEKVRVLVFFDFVKQCTVGRCKNKSLGLYMYVHTFWKALMTFEAVCTMQKASLMDFLQKFIDDSLKHSMKM